MDCRWGFHYLLRATPGRPLANILCAPHAQHTTNSRGSHPSAFVHAAYWLGISGVAALSTSKRLDQCQRSALEEKKNVLEFFEIEMETNEPDAVSEIFFAMGASSASSREQANSGMQRAKFVVTAQFEHDIDIEQCSTILMSSLDLANLPSLKLRRLGRGTWINHFPLCKNFVVRLPCHRKMAEERGATSVYLEGSTAFGAGRGPEGEETTQERWLGKPVNPQLFSCICQFYNDTQKDRMRYVKCDHQMQCTRCRPHRFQQFRNAAI